MAEEDSFLTISAPTEGLFKDRGSKFLGYAYPIRTEREARELWLQLKEIHPKAVHWCYAWRLSSGLQRSSDDGEPSGSAGKPMLNVLLSRNLTNVLVVVVRYFGGTLLGVPGLINAYKTTTEVTLDEAEAVTDYRTTTYQITFPYESMNAVMRAVKEMDLEVRNPVYEMTCQLEVTVRQAFEQEFLGKCSRGEGVVLTPLS